MTKPELLRIIFYESSLNEYSMPKAGYQYMIAEPLSGFRDSVSVRGTNHCSNPVD
jgi:hypothetical protein